MLLWLLIFPDAIVVSQALAQTGASKNRESVSLDHGMNDGGGRTSRIEVERGDGGMVVSDSAVASRIGANVLADGGNAVDAAVATAFALAVSWPDAGNIGGGGFMMIRPADGHDPVCIDYREIAPMSMNARSFTRADTTFSHKAVGVPGTVRGLALAHRRYGRLPWKDLVIPAARLAQTGVQVDAPLAATLNSVLSEHRIVGGEKFAEFRRVFGHPDNRTWKPGDQLRQPDLAKTLSTIAEQGESAFYDGSIARLIVQEMMRGDGEISLMDLKGYQSKVRSVIRGEYRGYTILGAPPPSSGGTCIVEALNILETFDLSKRDRYDPITVHLITEAMRRAFADRAMHLGDPDFATIPKHLTEKEYGRELAAGISQTRATPSGDLGPPISEAEESPDTTHFSVVDSDGMAVSNTYTLEATWGSRIVVPGAGFVLNNEMGDFNWFPGETNSTGRIGTPANQLSGGKRMLSSQCPVIVERDGKLVLVTGSPGGRTIINTVLCILIQLIDFEQKPSEAVSSMRMHHQWFPDTLLLEKIDQEPHRMIAARLREMGHRVANRQAQGAAHTIAVDPTDASYVGVSDDRRSGRPASLRSQRVGLWHFDEPAGTSLLDLKPSGEHVTQWSSHLLGAMTNGFDHLRLSQPGGSFSQGERSPPKTASDNLKSISSIRLPLGSGKDASPGAEKPKNAVMVEIKIDGFNFDGEDFNEIVSFRLEDENEGTSVGAATLHVGRRGEAGIGFWLTTRDHESPYVPLSEDPMFDTPTLLQVRWDSRSGEIRLATRAASKEFWTTVYRTTLGMSSLPDKFSMILARDTFEEGEWVDIDRIEILRE